MDLVLIQKILSLLIYPVGLVSVLLLLALFCRILRKRALSVFCICLALMTFLLSSNNYIAKSLVTSLEQQYPQLSIENTPIADAIIVLGGSLAPPATPRKFSQFTGRSNRFWLAGKLYLAGKAKYIILSGGNVFRQKHLQAEAHYVREKLIEMGVPDKVILIEPNSRTTQENALETKKLIEKTKAKSALLVTSAIHMPRSMQLFSTWDLDIKIVPTPSDVIVSDITQPSILTILPNSSAINLSTQALHEYYGMGINKLKYLLK